MTRDLFVIAPFVGPPQQAESVAAFINHFSGKALVFDWDPCHEVLLEFFKSSDVNCDVFSPTTLFETIRKTEGLKDVMILLCEQLGNPAFNSAQILIFSTLKTLFPSVVCDVLMTRQLTNAPLPRIPSLPQIQSRFLPKEKSCSLYVDLGDVPNNLFRSAGFFASISSLKSNNPSLDVLVRFPPFLHPDAPHLPSIGASRHPLLPLSSAQFLPPIDTDCALGEFWLHNFGDNLLSFVESLHPAGYAARSRIAIVSPDSIHTTLIHPSNTLFIFEGTEDKDEMRSSEEKATHERLHSYLNETAEVRKKCRCFSDISKLEEELQMLITSFLAGTVPADDWSGRTAMEEAVGVSGTAACDAIAEVRGWISEEKNSRRKHEQEADKTLSAFLQLESAERGTLLERRVLPTVSSGLALLKKELGFAVNENSLPLSFDQSFSIPSREALVDAILSPSPPVTPDSPLPFPFFHLQSHTHEEDADIGLIRSQLKALRVPGTLWMEIAKRLGNELGEEKKCGIAELDEPWEDDEEENNDEDTEEEGPIRIVDPHLRFVQPFATVALSSDADTSDDGRREASNRMRIWLRKEQDVLLFKQVYSTTSDAISSDLKSEEVMSFVERVGGLVREEENEQEEQEEEDDAKENEETDEEDELPLLSSEDELSSRLVPIPLQSRIEHPKQLTLDNTKMSEELFSSLCSTPPSFLASVCSLSLVDFRISHSANSSSSHSAMVRDFIKLFPNLQALWVGVRGEEATDMPALEDSIEVCPHLELFNGHVVKACSSWALLHLATNTLPTKEDEGGSVKVVLSEENDGVSSEIETSPFQPRVVSEAKGKLRIVRPHSSSNQTFDIPAPVTPRHITTLDLSDRGLASLSPDLIGEFVSLRRIDLSRSKELAKTVLAEWRDGGDEMTVQTHPTLFSLRELGSTCSLRRIDWTDFFETVRGEFCDTLKRKITSSSLFTLVPQHDQTDLSQVTDSLLFSVLVPLMFPATPLFNGTSPFTFTIDRQVIPESGSECPFAVDARQQKRIADAHEAFMRLAIPLRVIGGDGSGKEDSTENGEDEDTKNEWRWTLCDDLFSRMAHSSTPNMRVRQVLSQKNGMVTVGWPIRDIFEGEVLSRDYFESVGSAEERRMLENLLVGVNDEARREEARPLEILSKAEPVLPSPSSFSFLPLTKDVIKVMADSKLVADYLTQPPFRVLDSAADESELAEADVVWVTEDIRTFLARHPQLAKGVSEGRIFVNQFDGEECMLQKHSFAKLVELSGTNPSWFNETFNVSESDGKRREKAMRDVLSAVKEGQSIWIAKPWNEARSRHIVVHSTDPSSGLDCGSLSPFHPLPPSSLPPSSAPLFLLRLRAESTHPRIVQKYIEQPVLTKHPNPPPSSSPPHPSSQLPLPLFKFDLRFVVMLHSVSESGDAVLLLNKQFWIRMGNHAFSQSSFGDYEKHFTVMNYKQNGETKVDWKQMHFGEFVELFEANMVETAKALNGLRCGLSSEGNKWEDVMGRIKAMLHSAFKLGVGGKAVEGQNEQPTRITASPTARALYGVDIMLSRRVDLKTRRVVVEPVLVECNFQPDCLRACTQSKNNSFFNDVFTALFIKLELRTMCESWLAADIEKDVQRLNTGFSVAGLDSDPTILFGANPNQADPWLSFNNFNAPLPTAPAAVSVKQTSAPNNNGPPLQEPPDPINSFRTSFNPSSFLLEREAQYWKTQEDDAKKLVYQEIQKGSAYEENCVNLVHKVMTQVLETQKKSGSGGAGDAPTAKMDHIRNLDIVGPVPAPLPVVRTALGTTDSLSRIGLYAWGFPFTSSAAEVDKIPAEEIFVVPKKDALSRSVPVQSVFDENQCIESYALNEDEEKDRTNEDLDIDDIWKTSTSAPGELTRAEAVKTSGALRTRELLWNHYLKKYAVCILKKTSVVLMKKDYLNANLSFNETGATTVIPAPKPTESQQYSTISANCNLPPPPLPPQPYINHQIHIWCRANATPANKAEARKVADHVCTSLGLPAGAYQEETEGGESDLFHSLFSYRPSSLPTPNVIKSLLVPAESCRRDWLLQNQGSSSADGVTVPPLPPVLSNLLNVPHSLPALFSIRGENCSELSPEPGSMKIGANYILVTPPPIRVMVCLMWTEADEVIAAGREDDFPEPSEQLPSMTGLTFTRTVQLAAFLQSELNPSLLHPPSLISQTHLLLSPLPLPPDNTHPVVDNKPISVICFPDFVNDPENAIFWSHLGTKLIPDEIGLWADDDDTEGMSEEQIKQHLAEKEHSDDYLHSGDSLAAMSHAPPPTSFIHRIGPAKPKPGSTTLIPLARRTFFRKGQMHALSRVSLGGLKSTSVVVQPGRVWVVRSRFVSGPAADEIERKAELYRSGRWLGCGETTTAAVKARAATLANAAGNVRPSGEQSYEARARVVAMPTIVDRAEEPITLKILFDLWWMREEVNTDRKVSEEEDKEADKGPKMPSPGQMIKKMTMQPDGTYYYPHAHHSS
ncbi:putative tubulin--tyrosine ligase-like protein 12 [Blattamonas nauphoetae]|uniref:Tubulin--tyrosine ligase-like protein 12 n=1 Tax=Blattamonas nauphoetae TaxID=2049346 RepID=A0ABQ9XMK8_9EUKA|nr:putative tubulin--tyrosine ligase-like protein 12 [Blattamonas nauphoetae]